MMPRYSTPVALKIAAHEYLRYEKRDWGINLGWSDAPVFEWQFRRPGHLGPIDPRLPVGLWNSTADDFVVYAERDWGINLRWLKDTTRTDPNDWVLEGTLPRFALRNVTAAGRHDAYVVYGKRDRGIDLVWGRQPGIGNVLVELLASDKPLPGPGLYVPGEGSIGSARPRTWTVEWDGHDGLDFLAYRTVMRAPYVQNVTTTSATVIWRVGLPKGWDPAVWASRVKAKAWVALETIAPVQGRLYSTGDAGFPITARNVADTYVFEQGVRYDRPALELPDQVRVLQPAGNPYWLQSYADRPVIEFRVTFHGLLPGKTWRYRIECDGILDEDDQKLSTIVMADDVRFRTAPDPAAAEPVRFVAMGDLGPGSSNKPSYSYDVFDVFHRVCREKGAQLWLALGDIDNDTDGHPNAIDPFFFHVYNAFHDRKDPRITSYTRRAQPTPVKAFRDPPYFGLLGGMPVVPTFGNHDVCEGPGAGVNESSLAYLRKAYFGSFPLPPEGWDEPSRLFNRSGSGYFYTVRYGNVIVVSLGVPQLDDTGIGGGRKWKREWGEAQQEALDTFLAAIARETARPDVWLVTILHDHKSGLSADEDYGQRFLKGGVDLVLMGHEHVFMQRTVADANVDYRAVVVGTGGYGDLVDPCHRPGFLLAEAKGPVLQYWKYDSHRCNADGDPPGRDPLSPGIREYCRITKTGFGRHIIEATAG
jgi:hypothetical protein